MQMQTDDSNTAVDMDPAAVLDTPNNNDDPAVCADETPSSFLVTATENIDDDNDDQCVNCSRNKANIDDKSISSSSSTVSTATTQPDVSRDVESCLPSKANPTVIMNKIKPVTLEDLRVLTQCFYLPYEHGSLGHEMIQRFKWLKTHCQKLSTCKNKTTEAYMVKVG